MDNLPLLKDIHLPPEKWIFPLGYGWLILVLGLIAAFVLFRHARRIYLRGKKYYALELIRSNRENSVAAASQISELLRRICLYKYKNAVSLFGKDWVLFLNAHCKRQISGNAARLLIYAPYLPKNGKYAAEDYEKLRQFAADWIGENL